jgi:hypothetical protein
MTDLTKMGDEELTYEALCQFHMVEEMKELQEELLSRLKKGRKAVEAMEKIENLSFPQDFDEFDKIMAEWRAGND